MSKKCNECRQCHLWSGCNSAPSENCPPRKICALHQAALHLGCFFVAAWRCHLVRVGLVGLVSFVAIRILLSHAP